MSGNLFSDLYVVKEHMFHKMPAEQEIDALRKEVESCINGDAIPNKLHYLMFKMTNKCNSDCEYCPHAISRTHNEVKNDISKDIIIKTIHEAADLGVTAISVNGGEPLTRPDIYEIIQTIIDDGVVPVLMTNGLLLPKMWDDLGAMGLKYVIISFDSLIKEVYEKQRGCSFERALEGIEAAVRMKQKYENVEIHVSAVLTRDNQDDFINLVKYMTARGIKIHISPFHNYLQLKDEISISERDKIENLVARLLKMKKEGYLIASSTGFIKHLTQFFCDGKNVPDDYLCKIGYTNLFVDAHMNVRPCWSEAIGSVGILGENTLQEIWNSEHMQSCRKKMLRCECEGCWYMCTGEVTMLIDDILDE